MARICHKPRELPIRTTKPRTPQPVRPPPRRRAGPPAPHRRRWLLLAGLLVGLAVRVLLVPGGNDAEHGFHRRRLRQRPLTFVAPRVAGQVSRVLVDDNYRVKKGDCWSSSTRNPTRFKSRSRKPPWWRPKPTWWRPRPRCERRGPGPSNRFKLEHAIEDVNNQIANLRANVATLNSKKATLELARANLKRGEELGRAGASARKNSTSAGRRSRSTRRPSIKRSRRSTRPGSAWAFPPSQTGPRPDRGAAGPRPELLHRPPGLGAIAPERGPVRLRPDLVEGNAETGRRGVLQAGPRGQPGPHLRTALFPTRRPSSRPRPSSLQARRDLEQAELNLRYCDVVSEIDGVVTRRNVNPGNNVQVGQSLMAVRSLTEIWIDANFKETQLADLRIGQRVRCEVDMYGSRREFEGRITGFTMGTGQTLALLPPQNATGNFVKIVQRLPVRIELTNYDPDKAPLFVGLSVVPYVYYKEPPTGPHAGEVLQPRHPLPQGPTVPNAREALRPSAPPRRPAAL